MVRGEPLEESVQVLDLAGRHVPALAVDPIGRCRPRRGLLDRLTTAMGPRSARPDSRRSRSAEASGADSASACMVEGRTRPRL